MPKTGGKPVQANGIIRRKNSAQLSTWLMDIIQRIQPSSAKAHLIPQLIPVFPQVFSPTKIAVSPLYEHYFYPVSTAPTIRSTKENLKER